MVDYWLAVTCCLGALNAEPWVIDVCVCTCKCVTNKWMSAIIPCCFLFFPKQKPEMNGCVSIFITKPVVSGQHLVSTIHTHAYCIPVAFTRLLIIGKAKMDLLVSIYLDYNTQDTNHQTYWIHSRPFSLLCQLINEMLPVLGHRVKAYCR